MPCKQKFQQYIKINKLRENGNIEGMWFFNLIVGPFTVQMCSYKLYTGAVMFPQNFKRQRFFTCKGNFISSLRALIIAAIEKERGIKCPIEYRFEKKK